jgi:ABC-type transport system involved in multi-copper enzyme maturation permease subunit
MAMKKALIVAKTDLKMALEVNMVKYGLILAGAFGPIMVILSTVGTAVLVPPSEIPELMGFLAPYTASLLSIFGIIPATMISANSLVGEKEQNTLEPLLCTPLTDRELLMGKTLSSAIPCLLILFSGTLVSMIASNIALLMIGASLVLLPDLPGLFLIFTAAPVMIFAVVAVMIIISGRVSRVYEAYQSSGAVILVFMIPMIFPLIGIEQGVPSPSVIWMTNLLTLLIAGILFSVSWAIALGRFNRDKLISTV